MVCCVFLFMSMVEGGKSEILQYLFVMNTNSFCKEHTVMLFSYKGGKGVDGSGRLRQGEFIFVLVMAKQS